MQDAKKLADMAAAAKVYAEKAKLGEEAIRYAESIRIEALARLGRGLKATPRAKGGQPYQKPTGSKVELVESPTLAELGLTKKESSLAQKIADVAESPKVLEAFARSLARARATLKNRHFLDTLVPLIRFWPVSSKFRPAKGLHQKRPEIGSELLALTPHLISGQPRRPAVSV